MIITSLLSYHVLATAMLHSHGLLTAGVWHLYRWDIPMKIMIVI